MAHGLQRRGSSESNHGTRWPLRGSLDGKNVVKATWNNESRRRRLGPGLRDRLYLRFYVESFFNSAGIRDFLDGHPAQSIRAQGWLAPTRLQV